MTYPWFYETLRSLSERAATNVLHHGLLCVAPEGIGKTQFASDFAKYLLCKQSENRHEPCGHCQSCMLFEAGSHPDLHQIMSEKQVGVDAVREGIGKLNSTSQLQGRKVLIIHGAHSMTESSANALLKTLEEPTAETYIILLADEIRHILPTILSRCEKVVLPQPDVKLTQQWLSKQDINIPEVHLRFYGTVPLSIRERFEDEGKFSLTEFFDGLSSVKRGETAAHRLSEQWQENALDCIRWFSVLIHHVYTISPDNQNVWKAHLSLLHASEVLRRPGINKTLILNDALQYVHLIPSNTLEEFSC